MRISDWSSDVCSSDLTFGISKAEGLEVLAGQWRVTRIAWQRAGISDIAPVIFPRANVPLDVFGHRQALLLPGANVDVIASRSAARRVGQGCVSTCRSRWSPDH